MKISKITPITVAAITPTSNPSYQRVELFQQVHLVSSSTPAPSSTSPLQSALSQSISFALGSLNNLQNRRAWVNMHVDQISALNIVEGADLQYLLLTRGQKGCLFQVRSTKLTKLETFKFEYENDQVVGFTGFGGLDQEGNVNTQPVLNSSTNKYILTDNERLIFSTNLFLTFPATEEEVSAALTAYTAQEQGEVFKPVAAEYPAEISLEEGKEITRTKRLEMEAIPGKASDPAVKAELTRLYEIHNLKLPSTITEGAVAEF